MSELPLDYKIEHDRLLLEMEPIVTRLAEIMQELPQPEDMSIIQYPTCGVIITPIPDDLDEIVREM